MLESVRISNFQSLKDTQVNLGVLTVLVGLSDLGKSAFFRAIRSVVDAASGSDFITYGQSMTKVELLLDGSKLVWEKGSGTNRYKLNDQIFEKPGRTPPPDIANFLAMGDVEFDKDLKLNLNFADQDDPPFLIPFPGGLTTSGVAKILGDLTNLNVLYRAQGMAENRRRQADGLVKVRLVDYQSIQSQLVAYEDLDSKIEILHDLMSSYESATLAYDQYTRLSTMRAEREDFRARHLAVKQEMEYIGPDYSTDLEELESLQTGLHTLESYLADYESLAKQEVMLAIHLRDVEDQYQDSLESLNELMESIDVCPVCDRPMPHNHTPGGAPILTRSDFT